MVMAPGGKAGEGVKPLFFPRHHVYHVLFACEQALLGVGGGRKRRELATMSQEFECRPQYFPRLPAVLAVRI